MGDFVADIARGDDLIEIQTGSFAALGRKLDHLLAEHRILVVHPVIVERIIEREGARPRRSPKRGELLDVFDQLVSIPTLLDHPHFALEVVTVSVVERRVADPSRRRGRGGDRTTDRRLREVLGRHRFERPTDLLELVPTDLPDPFTTADLARLLGTTRDRAQKIAYCLRALDLFVDRGRTRAGVRYGRR